MAAEARTAVEHYELLLAEHYTWMLGGDIRQTATRQAELLNELGLPDGGSGTAIDLGCGSGAQTLALTRLGFTPVIAVDTNRALLEELARHAPDPTAVRTVQGDLRTALPQVAGQATASAVVCMGDSLISLPAKTDIPPLLEQVHRVLAPGGHFVVTYRDLSVERHGTDRFIPVRTSAQKLLTCFLEYRDQDTVIVHDMLHSHTEGSWTLRTSSYPKLRVASSWLAARFRHAGLHLQHDAPGPGGTHILHARKP